MSDLYVCEVNFSCPECAEDSKDTVTVPFPDLAADKNSEMQVDGQVEVNCHACKEVFDAIAFVNFNYCSMQLIDHPDTLIHCDPPYYGARDHSDNWDDYSVPDNPEHIFFDTIQQLKLFAIEHCSPDPRGIMNRMIFTQAISALEAFLCDTLIVHVKKSDDAKTSLLTDYEPSRRQKLTLLEAFNTPDVVNKIIEGTLKSRIYHRIDDTAKLYEIAFGIQINDDKLETDKLKMAIGYRHDCVHRNGMDKNGDLLMVFSEEYVRSTIGLISRFARSIQHEVDGELPF